MAGLRSDPSSIVARQFPNFDEIYSTRGFRMFESIDRVYVNEKARRELGWQPTYDFARVLEQLASKAPIGSDLARLVGIKGYHEDHFADGPYPVS